MGNTNSTLPHDPLESAVSQPIAPAPAVLEADKVKLNIPWQIFTPDYQCMTPYKYRKVEEVGLECVCGSCRLLTIASFSLRRGGDLLPRGAPFSDFGVYVRME